MINSINRISGNIVDIVKKDISPGTVEISDGRISRINAEHGVYPTYIIPGFIDSHIHVESSMLTPTEFARVAVTHGTVGAVCDPHEIANVMVFTLTPLPIVALRVFILDCNCIL